MFFVLIFGSSCASNTGINIPTAKHPTENELTAMYACEELLIAWEEKHPAFFGGAYRDGEQCVVLLTDDNEENRSEILGWSSHDNILEFKTSVFSLNYLRSIYNKVSEVTLECEVVQDSEERLSKIYLSHNISVSDNCVIVRVIEIDEDFQTKLKQLDVEGGGQAVQFSVVNPELL